MEWLVVNWRFWLTSTFEILLLAVFFYSVFRFLRGTSSARVLTGLIVTLLFLLGITRFFHLDVLNWLLSKLSVYLAIGFLVLFQPEIRRALAEVGSRHVFSSPGLQVNVVEQIVQAAAFLAERRIGALIAVEREIGTRAVQETGMRLDSTVNWGLLASLFFPHTPLHDGGVVVRGDRILAAGCQFPLSQRSGLGKTIGMRHRAAIGLTEETDAVVVVVSEETGTVSVSYRGRLSQDVQIERLRRFLSKVLLKSAPTSKLWERVRRQIVPPPGGIEGADAAGAAESRHA